MSLKSQSGKSLIEILMVLVIVGILVTFSIAQFGNSKKNLERQNIVRELKVSLERARYDSVKRRAVNLDQMAYVTINDTASFSLAIDLNQNGTVESGEAREIDFANSGINFVGDASAYPIIVRFDRHGFITATEKNGAATTPNFTICKNCTASSANAENANVISVSPTGTVLMTAGGETAPTSASPAGSPIPAGSHINRKVTVNP